MFRDVEALCPLESPTLWRRLVLLLCCRRTHESPDEVAAGDDAELGSGRVETKLL